MSQLINELNISVYLVTVNDGDKAAGFVATWISKASLNDKNHKIVLVISKFNASTKFLLKSKHFVINQLSENQMEEFYLFGTSHSDQLDKFQGFTNTTIPQGRILSGVAGHATGEIVSHLETPDRIILYCSLSEEVTGLGTPMILKEALAKLSPERKIKLERKMQHDSMRDEYQFTLA